MKIVRVIQQSSKNEKVKYDKQKFSELLCNLFNLTEKTSNTKLSMWHSGLSPKPRETYHTLQESGLNKAVKETKVMPGMAYQSVSKVWQHQQQLK